MLAESVNEAFGSTICLKNNLLRVLKKFFRANTVNF